MSDSVQLEDALRIQRERVARRTAAVERMLRQTACGERPETPDLSAEQIAMHGGTLVAHLRVVIETWAGCLGPVPQPLSAAVMDAKRACLAASAQEVSDA